MVQRITFKFLESEVNKINKERGLEYRQRGFLMIVPSCGYYQLREICENGSSSVNLLIIGTTKEIYNYLLYRLPLPISKIESDKEISDLNFLKEKLKEYKNFIDKGWNKLDAANMLVPMQLFVDGHIKYVGSINMGDDGQPLILYMGIYALILSQGIIYKQID